MPKPILISLSATKAESVDELETIIKRASKMYYEHGRFVKINLWNKYPDACRLLEKNGITIDKGVEEVNDAAFDLFWDVLKELRPKSKVLIRTGVAVEGPTKVKLPYAMNGLEQKRPDSIDEWLKKNPGPYVISDKEDGVSFEVVHEKSGKAEAYTKGDSDMGNRVTKMLPHMNVPKLKADVAIRAEMIMPVSVFNSKHSKALKTVEKAKRYENARNMVAGATNPKRRDIHPALKDIDVVAYEVLNPRLKPSDQFKLLKKLGYKVAPFSLHRTLSSGELVKLMKERKAASKYEMDGLVIAQDKVYPIAKGDSYAKHMVKFKFNDESSIVEVKVLGVEWESSKHEKLIPRVNIPPTRMAGVTVDWATGHNAFFIANGFSKKDVKKNLPVRPVGPGAVIRITRSGDVIPYIVEVVKGAKKPALPDAAHTWGKTGVHIFQNVKTELSAVKRISYFFSKLDVEGLKIGTVQKMYDAGLNTILKIVKANKAKFLAIDGIQDKTATKLVANMKTALDKMTLPALMDASGQFGQGMGEKRIKLVLKWMPNVLESKIKPKDLVAQIADQVDGFSTTLAQQFVDGLPGFNTFYARLGIKAQAIKPTKVLGKAFKGQTVVWTGFRNAAQELKVAEYGGVVGSGVSSKTTILVIKDQSFTSSKVTKAKDLGITILTNATMQARLDKVK